MRTLSVPLSSIGTTAPSLIVSYLRANPDINRIAVGYDGSTSACRPPWQRRACPAR